MSRHPYPVHRSLRLGFSLLELTVVLAIVSLIAGVGMTMANNALKSADRIATQEKLNTIKLALDSHAKTYGYLPCPADRALTPTSANFGVENRNNYTTPSQTCSVAAPGIASSGTERIGMVPVRTLGLPDSYAVDAWGNKLMYAVSEALAANPASYASQENGSFTLRFGNLSTYYNITPQRKWLAYTSVANNGGGLARLTFASTGSLVNGVIVHVNGGVYKGSYVVAGRTATTIDLTGSTYSATDTGTVEWQEFGTNAGYIVVSHGPDGRGAYPLNATAIPATKKCNDDPAANSSPPPCTSSATTTCIDIENCDDDTLFFDADYNDGVTPAQYFDDYVVWGSNALQRNAVNKTLYTSNTTSTCPAGVCEAWCAACVLNYPGAETAAPPTTELNDATIAITLCKKVITSNATDCKATCFWSGRNTAGRGYYKCP